MVAGIAMDSVLKAERSGEFGSISLWGVVGYEGVLKYLPHKFGKFDVVASGCCAQLACFLLWGRLSSLLGGTDVVLGLHIEDNRHGVIL